VSRGIKALLIVPEPERMAGQLQRHPLTELVREISAAGLSGALRLVREQAKAVIYFDSGEIVYAASNLRVYRLIESVRRWKILSEQQLASVSEKTHDVELSAALVEAGILSREKLEAVVERQVSELLCHTLLWTEGDWDFDPRVRLADGVRVTIKPEQLLMESARRLPVEFVAQRFSDRDEKIFPVSLTTDELNLLPKEAFVLTRVDAPLSINEMLAVGGLPETETLHIIYALALGGFLGREKWPQGLSAEEIAKGRAVKAAPAKETATFKAEPKSEPQSLKATQAANAVEAQYDEQSEIEALFAIIDRTTDHYQMLGVRRSANADEIKRSYYALAKRFHPDRFRRGVEAAQIARIESAFAQIAQAYETLKSSQTRAAYDSKLLKKDETDRTNRATVQAKKSETNHRPVSSAASVPSDRQQDTPLARQAEEIFQEGWSALQQGNRGLAIASLGEAARLVPTEPRYRAYFGKALASDEKLRHSAETEIKAAISLDARNASYRVMLAELYSEIGLIRRALGELDRVLSTDPQNDAALKLRGKLKGRG
jgi:curved DNA-binding protein CbpA